MFISSIEIPLSIEKIVKWKNFGDVNVKTTNTTPQTYTIKLYNTEPYEIKLFSYDVSHTKNSFYSFRYDTLLDDSSLNKTWGFDYQILLNFDRLMPYIIPPGTSTNPTVIDFARVSYTGKNLNENELNSIYGLIFKFYTDDDQQELKYKTTGIKNNEVVFEATPVGNRWQPKAKIIYKDNIHLHLETPKINSLNLWNKYAEKRINETLLGDVFGSTGTPQVRRIKIKDFLNQPDFINNKIFDDDKPEPKRVFNRFKDPLPPYDFIWPYGDNYAYTGLRRTYDYIISSRVNRYYAGLEDNLKKYSANDFSHPFYFRRDLDLTLVRNVNGKNETRQRREWGFREKVLKGFPYYIPKYIQTATNGITPGAFSTISPYNNPCGAGPVIAGFVTAGSGIFSGVQPSVELEYDGTEAKRTIKSATDIPYKNPRVPNGLIFIQDETGAMGFSIGTDMRYMEDPFYHDAHFTKPGVENDEMHLGSYGLPKPDYRQFLREGDLVIIQVGVGFKYWHPVLGSQPMEWEKLRGIDEAGMVGASEKIEYPEEVVDMGDDDISDLQCSCTIFELNKLSWKELGSFNKLASHDFSYGQSSIGQTTANNPTPELPSDAVMLNSSVSYSSVARGANKLLGQPLINEKTTTIRLGSNKNSITYSSTPGIDNYKFIEDTYLNYKGSNASHYRSVDERSNFIVTKLVGKNYTYEFESALDYKAGYIANYGPKDLFRTWESHQFTLYDNVTIGGGRTPLLIYPTSNTPSVTQRAGTDNGNSFEVYFQEIKPIKDKTKRKKIVCSKWNISTDINPKNGFLFCDGRDNRNTPGVYTTEIRISKKDSNNTNFNVQLAKLREGVSEISISGYNSKDKKPITAANPPKTIDYIIRTIIDRGDYLTLYVNSITSPKGTPSPNIANFIDIITDVCFYSDGTCVPVRDTLRRKNAKVPCDGMSVGEQKIVRLNSSNGPVSFMFILDQSGNCLCRKLLTGLADAAMDYIWPAPPTQNFPNAKAYIDNWGGYTYPQTSQIKEAAIDIPNIPLFEIFGLLFGHDDNPEQFDAGYPHDEALVDVMAYYVRNVVMGANVGMDVLDLVSKLIVDDPTLPVDPKFAQVVLLVAVIQIGATSLMNSVYQRNKHILPSRISRDTQFPFTDFHPIQHEHPWSTGTPIPVNSGMEYIMSDVFSVDNRERFSPPPRIITNAELRGIPVETWKYNPADEWKIPFDDQLKFQKSSKFEVTPENQYEEFPDRSFISKTPYTQNPGSVYKGQLIKLKNVRFVQAPSRTYSVFVPQALEKKNKFKNEYNSTIEDLRKYLIDNPENKITDYEISITGTPFENLNLSGISDAFLAIMDVLNPIIDLAQTIINVFEVLEPKVSEYINRFIDILQVEIKKIEDGAEKIRNLKTTGKIKGFRDEYDVARFIAISNETDLTGFKVGVNFERELMNHAFNSESPFSLIDVNKMLNDFTNFVINKLIKDAEEAAKKNNEKPNVYVTEIAKSLDRINSIWNQYYIQDKWEIDEAFEGPVEPILLYDFIQKPSTFPWSLDLNDGGYWWTHPDIPLTNARSHQNDAYYGVPGKWSDHDLSFFFSHGDGSFGIFSNLFTSRQVFTQLVSSNKKSVTVKKYFPDDASNVFESSAGQQEDIFSDTHEYVMSHIRERYVKDLGLEYRASYEPFAEEWKPYRYVDGNTITKNNFTPIEPGTQFYGNKVYYVVDEDNVVVPIRINANTEIGRYNPLVPTGSVDIVGIAWQYSGGTPGMEWERERYMMQVWPRYFSDVGVKWTPPTIPKLPEIDGGGGDTPDFRPPDGPRPPRKLPDLTLDIGDAGNPARLDCESVKSFMDSKNRLKEQLQEMSSWPVDRKSNELDPNSDNVHKDPVSGREITFPSDQSKIKQMLDSMPDYPCKGMQPGDQRNVIVTSEQFPGVTRTFFFTVGPNGECLCTMYQPGTEGGGPVDVGTDTSTFTGDESGTFGGGSTPTGDGGIFRRRSDGGILG